MRAVSHPYRLWLWLTLCLAVLGCQKSATPTAPTGTLAPTTPVTVSFGPGESIPAMFEVTIDPSAMSATSHPLIARTAAGFQASQFDLDITKFQKQAQFDVQSVQFTAIGDVEVTFRHAHPWGPVDIALPPSATNRADLGYTGRLLILADLQPADIPSHTFFTDVKANTELIRGADGYVQPGDLLAKSGFNANCFPYMLLADEAKDNRVEVSNGGVVTGNWDPAVGGWQRSNLGPNGDGWTGYDFVHAGQTIENSFVLNADELTGGPVTLQVALLIKYTEPKGVGGEVGRTLRLPPATVDVLQFAYRAPHAALDCSQIRLPDPYAIGNIPEQIDPILQIESTMDQQLDLLLEVRDWDSTASEANGDLSAQTDIAAIGTLSGGPPQGLGDCPGVSIGDVVLPSTAGASGLPGAEWQVTGTLTNSMGAVAGGLHTILVRVQDADAGNETGALHFGVDPDTLAADPARAIPLSNYSAIRLRTVHPPPVWTAYELPTAGQSGSYSSLALLPGPTPSPADDRVAIAFTEDTNRDLWIGIADSTSPIDLSHWTFYTLASAGDQGHGIEGIVRDSQWFLFFYDNKSAGGLYLASATQAVPLTAADWSISTVRSPIGSQGEAIAPSVAPDGTLSVAYFDSDADQLWWVASSQMDPDAQTDWDGYALGCVPDGGGFVDVIRPGGRPAVVFNSCPEPAFPLQVLLSDSLTPGTNADWQPVTHGLSNSVFYGDIVIAGGQLWVTTVSFTGVGFYLRNASLARAGTSAAWNRQRWPHTEGSLAAFANRVAVWRGLPLWIASDDGVYGTPALRVARALRPVPRERGDWQSLPVVTWDRGDSNDYLVSGDTLSLAFRSVNKRASFAWGTLQQ